MSTALQWQWVLGFFIVGCLIYLFLWARFDWFSRKYLEDDKDG